MDKSAINRIRRSTAKRILIALTLMPLFFSPAYSAKTDENAPFKPGEKLAYQAKWGVFPAGELTLEVLPMTTIKGIDARHFAMTTKTNAFVDRIYKVRERQESYVDVGMTHSILYTKQSEGEHPRDVVVDFDWEKLKTTRSNFGKKGPSIPLLPGSFDTLALFYVVRLHELREKSVIEIPITDGNKNVVVTATVAKRERISIGKHDYDTFKVIPDMESLESQKAFKKGDVPQLIIWFTADDQKLPVKIQSKVKVGYFTFELSPNT